MNNNVTLKIGYDSSGNIAVVHADKLTLKGTKINDTWVLRSNLFNITGYSTKSREDSFNSYTRLLKNFFQHHLSKGTLEKALRGIGWEANIKQDESNRIEEIDFIPIWDEKFTKDLTTSC